MCYHAGTSGIGKQTILLLVPHNPARIVFTGRSTARAQQVIDEAALLSPRVQVDFVQMDLGDLTSVKTSGEQIAKMTEDRLDILINNAGIAFQPPGVTKQGYELMFGTNHLGHAGLTHILLPNLTKTARTLGSDVRIVNLSSLAGLASAPAQGILFDKLRTKLNHFLVMGGPKRYGHSKLANHLTTVELAKRYPELTSVTVHPGLVATEGAQSLPGALAFMLYLRAGKSLTPQAGAYTTLWAATSTKKGKADLQGGWFVPVGDPAPPVPRHHLAQSARLWEWSQEQLAANGF